MSKIANEAEFWAQIEVCEHGWQCEDCCWPWHSGQSIHHGTVELPDGQLIKAHRLAKMLMAGAGLLPGICVCHTCDYPPCCNPSHLFAGTRRDNAQDFAEKRKYGAVAIYTQDRRKFKAA